MNCGREIDSSLHFCPDCGVRQPANAPGYGAAGVQQGVREPRQGYAQPPYAQPGQMQPHRQPAPPQPPQWQQNQQPYGQPSYGQAPYGQAYPVVPVMLKTDRSLAMYILLSIITFGIYGIVVMSGVSQDINTIATRYDNRNTTHYCLVFFLLSWLTLGIYPLVWMHQLSDRIGNELIRRRISNDFGAKDFWLWCVLGSLIIVGPFIYYYKLFDSMNKLALDYNMKG